MANSEDLKALAQDMQEDLNDQLAVLLTGPSGGWKATANWRDTHIQRMVNRRKTAERLKALGEIKGLFPDEKLAVQEMLAGVGIVIQE